MADAPNRKAWRALAAAAVCALALACATRKRHPEVWQEIEVRTPSETVLWTVAGMALEKSGFPVGSGADPRSLEIASGWRNSLSPFSGDGYRQRAFVRFERVEPRRYRVSVRVARQENKDIARPLDLSYAKWEDAPDEVALARVLSQRIASALDEALEPEPAQKAQ
jgi:hypothetical protein